MKQSFWRQSADHWLWSVVLVIAGLANTAAFAPYHWHSLPLLTLTLLAAAVLQATSVRQAAWFGWCYGVGWFGLGVSWVHVSIATFGGMPLIASLSIMALLVAYLSLFPAIAGAVARWFAQTTSSKFALTFAVCWTLGENLRSWLFSGFPWLSVGYSQVDGYLAPYAPFIGETGISFLLVFCGAVFAQYFVALMQKTATTGTLQTQRPRATPSLALALTVGLFAIAPLLQTFAGWHLSGKTQQVALVQGNIQQELRWAPEQELPTMKKYMTLSRDALPNSLMIWPEAAVPQIEPLAQAYLINLDMLATEQNAAVVTGILDYKRSGDAYNGMIVVGQTANQQHYVYGGHNRYQKHHLLPIGEFVPLESWLRDVAPFFDLPNSSFARGNWQQDNLYAKGYRLLPALCFEIAFPRQIYANFSNNTDFLLTVSNDAWFGDSIGPWQHLDIARMRALEFGRPLLRATNNGITAIVAADGQILAQLPQFTAGVLKYEVPLTTGRTLYSQLGDWPLYSLCIILFTLGLWQRRLHMQTAALNTSTAVPPIQMTSAPPTAPNQPAKPQEVSGPHHSPAKERIEPHF